MTTRRRELALVAGTGLTTALIFLLVRHSLVDDAYITLGYARNLAQHLHWGLIPHQVANTATSPLNVVLLAVATAAIRIVTGSADAVWAAGVVSVGLAMLMAWCWTRVARGLRLPFAAAVLGVALVLANPFLLSAFGLEVLLAPALLVAMLAAALERRAGWFGVAAGLTLLARLDLAVFVPLIAVATPAMRAGWRKLLATAAAVAGPWFVFSWIYLGSVVPDTLVIRTLQRDIWGRWDFFNGPVMYATGAAGRPNAVALAFAPAVLGLATLVGWSVLRRSSRWGASDAVRRLGPAAGLGAGGVAYYLVLSAIRPGPYHWYYVPPAAALSIFLAIALGTWLTGERARPGRSALAPVLALGVAALLAVGSAARDVKQGVPWRSPVFSTNFATASDYARVGRALRTRVGGATVGSYGEIGTLAYYCRCEIVDVYSHRGEAVQLIKHELDTASPVVKPVLELNYEWLDRDEKPPRLGYALGYRHGPGSGADVWQVHSRWTGAGHVRLIRLRGSPVAPIPELGATTSDRPRSSWRCPPDSSARRRPSPCATAAR